MAYQSIWYYTDIPEKVVNLIEEDLSEKFEDQMQNSTLAGDTSNLTKRNSQNAWIPTDHWVGGFIWHYIQRANRENFLYDIDCIDNDNCEDMDCLGQCGGTFEVDECGECGGPGPVVPCQNTNGLLFCTELECEEYLLDVADALPKQLVLSQNYPNPFNPTTVIEYAVPTLSQTNLSLYDIQGRKLKTLINSMHRPGYYQIALTLNDLHSGIYIVKIVSGNATRIRKIAFIK